MPKYVNPGFQKCHTGRIEAAGGGDYPPNAAENTKFVSERTSDFSHLGLWPLECDRTSELVSQPNQSNGDEDN